jgi:hypothetical protein
MRVPRAPIWAFRTAWALLPLAVGPAVAAAIDGRTGAVRAVTIAGLWLAWALGLLASLVPVPAALTAMRLVAPGAPVVAGAAAVAGAGPLAAGVAVFVALVAAVLSATAEVGAWFVQGAAYGDESRFVLRPPGPLLAGPLELLWAVLAGACGAGPLLLASRQWVAGAIVTVVAAVLAVALVPRFHTLTLRWFVFVPAGVVVRDPLVLAETVMVRRSVVAAIALAPVDTAATDLTASALGPAVEVRFTAPTTVALPATRRGRERRSVDTANLLVSPTRPGRLVAEAARRGYTAVPPASTSVSVSS